MYQPAIRFAFPSAGRLNVPYASFEHAKQAFPACERTALRAFARSEAARLANALIRPKRKPDSFLNVVAMFADADAIGEAALRSKRFDFQMMLMTGGKFERRIARRLVRQGKLGAEVLS